MHRPMLWLVATAAFMQMLDTTIVNTALPSMATSLGESPLRMQAVVASYALAVAMVIPASGWLSDRFGTRRVFVAAIVLFSARVAGVRDVAAIDATGGLARAAGHRRRHASSGWPARRAARGSAAGLSRGHELRDDAGPDRPAGRADARRMARPGRLVALDLPDQSAARRRGRRRGVAPDA